MGLIVSGKGTIHYAKIITSHECGDIGEGKITGPMNETQFTYHITVKQNC